MDVGFGLVDMDMDIILVFFPWLGVVKHWIFYFINYYLFSITCFLAIVFLCARMVMCVCPYICIYIYIDLQYSGAALPSIAPSVSLRPNYSLPQITYSNNSSDRGSAGYAPNPTAKQPLPSSLPPPPPPPPMSSSTSTTAPPPPLLFLLLQ